jgi:hypothetical protein
MSFQEFADWFGAELMADGEALPLDQPCTCGNRRRISKHVPGCPAQLGATYTAIRMILEDARQEPPDFSMRTALMYLGTAFADRKGYDEGWRPIIPGMGEEVLAGRKRGPKKPRSD